MIIYKDDMKKQNLIYFALVTILMTGSACSAGGIAPSTEGGQTNPAATTIPAQEAVVIDGPPGPETIDLTNPVLYITSSAPVYKSNKHDQIYWCGYNWSRKGSYVVHGIGSPNSAATRTTLSFR